MTSVHLALGQTGADVASHLEDSRGQAADEDDKKRRGALFDVKADGPSHYYRRRRPRAEGCQLLGGKRPVFDSRISGRRGISAAANVSGWAEEGGARGGRERPRGGRALFRGGR